MNLVRRVLANIGIEIKRKTKAERIGQSLALARECIKKGDYNDAKTYIGQARRIYHSMKKNPELLRKIREVEETEASYEKRARLDP